MNDGPRDELISAFLDGELSAEERHQVEQLLADDPGCRQLYEELRMVRATVAGLPRHRLNKDLSRRVLRRAERRMLLGSASEKARGKAVAAPAKAASLAEAIWRRDWRTVLWPALAVSAALLLMVFNRGIWSPSNDPPAPSGAIAGKAPATGQYAERSRGEATPGRPRGAQRSAQQGTLWVIAEVSPESIRQSRFHELLAAQEISLAESAPRRSPPRVGAAPSSSSVRALIEEANRKAGETGEVAYVITGEREQIERTVAELRERDETYRVIEEKSLPEQEPQAISLASKQTISDDGRSAPAVARRYATRAEAEDAAKQPPADPAADPAAAAELVNVVIVLRSAAPKGSTDEKPGESP